jgi:hypothetical protein
MPGGDRPSSLRSRPTCSRPPSPTAPPVARSRSSIPAA